jgi:hypothetical protein
MLKMFNQKSLIILFGHLLVVELTHIDKFAAGVVHTGGAP